MIIDIDTHFEPGRSWLADHPALADRLPEFSVAESTVRAQVGDVPAEVSASFLGGNLAECYTRVRDPLSLASLASEVTAEPLVCSSVA